MATSTPSRNLNDEMTGVITRMLLEKGFCFIRGEDKISRFAHAQEFVSRVAFDLAQEGDQVTFTPDVGVYGKGNGLRCTKIKMITERKHVAEQDSQTA